ncbi:MAG: ATP-binding protein [Thermodesulfobacteriota bacterium]|nr:ATP-binding protein [Thermodesulfobacteriota bacterium]
MGSSRRNGLKKVGNTNRPLAELLESDSGQIIRAWTDKLVFLSEGGPVLYEGRVQEIVEDYLNILIHTARGMREDDLLFLISKVYLAREKPLGLLETQKALHMGKEVIYPFLEKDRKDNLSLFINDLKLIDRYVYRIIRQITGIEMSEMEKENSRLEKIRYYFENLTESSANAFIATDMGGKITYFSKGAEELFKSSAKELLGKRMSECYLKGEDEARRLMKILWQKGKANNFETRMIMKNHKPFFMDLSVSFIKDKTGEPVGTLGICRDITELKRLEYQIQKSEKLAAIGQLAAGLAHEVGTPLNVISGTAEYLMKDMNKSDPKYDDLETIESQANRIIKSLQLFLQSARFQEPELGSVSINDLIDGVLHLTRRQISDGNISVVTELSPDLPFVRGDPAQLQQVFLNIIMNAIHAMESGGELGVNTRLLPQGSISFIDSPLVEIAISDTGDGIFEENLSKLFDPFFTTKDMGKGTGLGLTVSHRIVENHHGIIEVESQVGKGTTFLVKLPVGKEENTDGK